ncbi:cobalt transporter ATP-binding subunit [Bacillus coahuilensis m2-6]|uniref:energy-coupling factor ABC transporter ATP-binding protein n=1 Tax=Bacillus coahuilensis TaxID=408580 RepID=UPI0007500D36|nr:energy-coupling factor ABC transporter ATP-binding protein [Bacillus coahuilensis]KUP04649.1 cobalt transporter ATP-binding subunit [Bacillus coahuilensis m2-6]
MEPLLKIENVSFRYRENAKWALEDISFQLQKGEWLAIVGHNGSGKSTLAKMLNALHFPTEGQITANGTILSEDTVWEIRDQVGMVFQHPDNQFVGTTVEDDVAFGLENHGVPHEEMKTRVREALLDVGMSDFLTQEPHHLSGGQKQRVAIASVLALRPNLIILDEATSMLDPKGRKEVVKTVHEMKEREDLTVISITHDLEEAAKADRIVMLNKGRIFFEGTPKELFQKHGDMLKELGLDLPFPVRLASELNKRGLTTSSGMSEEELVDEIWNLHLSK